MRLRSRRKRTRERVRKGGMLSLGKSNNRNNNKNNSRNNNKSNAKNKRDEFKGRAAKNLDDLVHTTDSSFTKAVISFPLPSKFRMPSLETFDGSKDPLDHLESFKTVMCLQGVPDEIMCRAFPTTLKGPARVWFKKITPGSVGSFAQLSRLFFNHFIGGQRYGRPTTHLLNIKQKEGETLRSYLTRFNKETLLVDGADDKVVLTAFISGLQAGDFLFSVYKDPPSTMTEMMYEAQRHMNGEEALLARDQTKGKKRKWEHPDRPAESHETRPKAQRNRNRRQEDRSGRGFNERFNHFTPLNAPVDHIFMQIRNDPALKWPGKLLTDPDKRQRDKYCRFHRDHGHNTEDCYDLKRQIEELIKQGKLQRFVERGQREGRPQGPRQQRPPVEVLPRPPPLGEIHVITGGVAAGGTSRSSRKAYARQIHNVLVTQKMDKKPRLEDLPITFAEEDARKVFHPHDDALVVTLEIAGYSTRRVLIDNGSSADIIYLTAFQQMRIDKDQLRPIETPLVGFAGTSVYPLGIITLQIIAGTYPKQATKKVNFLVVDCPSAYNVIIGCPTLNRLRAVTSTYHLLVRFPTENGIGEMRGDQVMARECYLTSTSTEPVHQALIVEERQNIAEPTEELEEIVLVEGLHNEKKTTWIGTSMTEGVRDSIVRFLRENADIFAWSHADMPGISTKRNAAIMEEVDKLLKAGFIREVYYPKWLANVVMVKKSTGKWRMCVDFTDLNKACPKDSYPLPRIDQLVDSTAGHKLLSFMDAFSGYNQIQMAEEDQEKTAFITSRGLFYYKVMPFGLKNAGATYQRLVNKMFHDQIGRNVEVYVDDMLVKSKKDDNHLVDLKETFQALRRYNMKLNLAKCVFGVSSGKFLGFMVSQRGIEANPDKIKAILEMSPPKTVKEVQSLTGKAAALNRFVSRSTDKCLPFFKILRKAFQWTEECQQAFEELKKPVYYTSRALRGAEERYTNMEKLAFALLIASRKLRPYFQAHSIIVMTYYPIRKAMNKPDAAGRLIQWSIEMSEFDIDYRPRTAIKAQALADFIAEFTHPLKEDKQSEECKAWTMNIDGSSTKEMSGAGVVLVFPQKDKFEYALQLHFRATNNEGEYEALLAGLKLSKSMGIKALTVKSDSQLIVGQVKGEYEAKEDRMKKYLTVVKDLLTYFEKVEFLQIPREDNVAADRLARLASLGIEIDGFIEIQRRPSTEGEETVNSITVVTTWMSPLIRYLREGTLPTDRAEAHKLRIRASHFRLMGGILYKMGFSRPHLRCLSPEEANYVIREVHEGICGNHSGAKSLAHKLTKAGYYWPSLLHDATQYVKTCDKCQRFANVPRVPPEEITPITSPWPFAQWGLDIMGPFPVGTKQAKFLVVAIDYFTKWVEAEPLATISEKNVRSFVWKAVICRFGIPRVLISDNGKQFDNGPFREMCSQLNIKNHYSSPRHPQANGQVEVTNRTLLKQIKTRLEGAKSMWVEELPSVLWAYRTTVRTPTKETPFKLTFGTEAVIPVEIGLTTFRTTFHREEENEGQLCLNLDLLDETREKAAQRIALYQGRMARYYNTKAPTGKALTRSPNITEGAPIIWKTVMERSYLILGTLSTSRSTTLELDTHEVHKLDTYVVHKLDTHEVHQLDTHEVHKLDTHVVQMLDTHEVHLQQKTVKTAPLFIEEDLQESSSVCYHVRHPRGAFIEEDLQESSSVCYHVRHPRGAFIEEDLQESSSVCYHVRHPRGAFIEEDLQESSSVCYHVRHPRGAFMEEYLP
uniref:RNA-directed DNA polymerase n=1 Tax=Fagus sylvatica TaxID=28930 RepID=A0A2N9I556_FAGSY